MLFFFISSNLVLCCIDNIKIELMTLNYLFEEYNVAINDVPTQFKMMFHVPTQFKMMFIFKIEARVDRWWF